MSGRCLVVVPTDPIEAYEAKGTASWLERYYNPGRHFERVVVLSPLEKDGRDAFGMEIVPVASRGFGAALRSIAPDVVRAYGGHWPADLVAEHRSPGIPIVVSVHDRRPSMLHRSLRLADAVLCTSAVVRREVLRVGVRSAQTRILPNRVDPQVFRALAPEADDAYRRFGPGRHVLHVGRLSPEKNPDTLIRALAELPDGYRGVFVGGGDPEPYRRLARDLGVAERCHFVGVVPNEELPRWYAGCACLCVPSRSEGFGLVFVEAAACGAAIVTSDRAPMREYLTHGENACLVDDPESPRAVADAVRRVVEDEAFGARIRGAARRASEPFWVDRVDALETDLYDEVLRGALGAPPSAAAIAAFRIERGARRLWGRVLHHARAGARSPRRA